jgi:hypothetical protein
MYEGCAKKLSKTGTVLVLIFIKITVMSRENKQGRSRQNTNPKNTSNMVKNPNEWATGEEEMTGAQRSYLKTLSEEAGEEFNEKLTKAEASKKIDELQHKTGRGINR